MATVAHPRFVEQLRHQLGFVERSCAAYDAGHLEEAVRIATTVRVLIHNTKNSTSLLSLLGARNINLLSTVREIDPNGDGRRRPVSFHGLGGSSVGPNGQMSHTPSLDRSLTKRDMPTLEWWEQIVYMVDGVLIRRCDLVLGAANQDGGAHVDRKLAPAYEAIRRGMFVQVSPAKLAGRVVDSTYAMGLRQIGYEILASRELVALLP